MRCEKFWTSLAIFVASSDVCGACNPLSTSPTQPVSQSVSQAFTTYNSLLYTLYDDVSNKTLSTTSA